MIVYKISTILADNTIIRIEFLLLKDEFLAKFIKLYINPEYF